MPAEWEPHAATWLSWPHKTESWPGTFERIPSLFAKVVRLLAPGEAVRITVNDGKMEKTVLEILRQNGALSDSVYFHHVPTNDAWCRDYGPIFLVSRQNGQRKLAAVNWQFNSWGGKYPPFHLDDLVPIQIADILGIPCFSADIVMEGGSLDVNGAGSLITTESCLLNPNRNPGLTKEEIEECLKSYLGVSHILWLGGGIAGDDTDGHVDDLTRFVDPQTVVTVVEENPCDENYTPLQDNLRRLESMRNQEGRPLQIAALPMPPPLYYEGHRLPCSYANFYIGNNVVLFPTYNCAADRVVQDTMERLFPTREAVGLDCRDLVWGFGALHCITQQQPAIDLGSSAAAGDQWTSTY